MALEAGQVSTKLTMDDSQFVMAMKGAKTAAKEFATDMQSLGGAFMKLSGPIGSINLGIDAMKRLGKEALAVGGAFEASMTSVAAISGANAEQLDRLTLKARELGATLPIMAKEAADAMGILASRGYDAEKMLSTVGDIVNLSIAQNYSVAGSADVVASALTNFKMEASDAGKVADIFTQASNRSALSMNKLYFALKYAAPPAAALGASLEETVAAMGSLADAGLQAEQIGTALRGIYTKIAQSTNILGVSTRDASGKVRALADIMSDLGSRGFGLDKFNEAFSAYGANAALILSKTSEKIRSLNDQLQDSSGATSRQVEKQMQTWENISKSFESRVESLYLTIFDQIKSTSKTTVTSLTDMTNALEQWINKSQVASKAMASFLKGIGMDFPEGADITAILEKIDVTKITASFEEIGASLRSFIDAATSLAKSVPWNTLLGNVDKLAYAAVGLNVFGKVTGTVTDTYITFTILKDIMNKLIPDMGNVAKAVDTVTASNTKAAKASEFFASNFAKLKTTIASGSWVVEAGIGTIAVALKAAQIITEDFAKYSERALDRASKAHEDFFKAVSAAQNGLRLKGNFTQDEERILSIYLKQAEAIAKQNKERETTIAEFKTLKARIDEISSSGATGSAAFIVNAASLTATKKRLEEIRDVMKEQGLATDEDRETWSQINAEIDRAQKTLEQMRATPLKGTVIDFSSVTESLTQETDKIRKQIADAVAQGFLSPQQGMQKFNELVESEITKQSEGLKSLGSGYAQAWIEGARKMFNLDAISTEVTKFREGLKSSRDELEMYAAYLTKTGNTSKYAQERLKDLTKTFASSKFAMLDTTGQQRVLDALNRLGKSAGNSYASALAKTLAEGQKGALDDAAEQARNKITVTVEDLTSALNTALAKEESKPQKPLKLLDFSFEDRTKKIQAEISGVMVEATAAEIKAMQSGNKQIEAEMKKRADTIAYYENLRKQQAAKTETVDVQKEIIDSEKVMQVLTPLFDETFKGGKEAMASLYKGMEAAQAELPVINLQAPKVDMSRFQSGFMSQIQTLAPALSTSVTSIFSGIDLTGTGRRLGATLTDGIVAQIGSQGVITKLSDAIYRNIAGRIKAELAGQGV